MHMTDRRRALTAAYFTLGCKLNFAETSTVGKLLADRGIARAADGERPDICVVNTCSVTAMADKKGRHLIRSIASRWPGVTLVVTGCYAQLKPDEVAALPGVDIVLGNGEKLRAAEYVDAWLADRVRRSVVTPAGSIDAFGHSCERGDRTRYFLKVQDGCDYFCTYCTIPYARGRSRSPQVAELVEAARAVAAEGGREIVLTGVNIGDFGRGSEETFFDLIRALDAVEGIERYRISSIEPNLLTPDIIRWVAEESRAFMPHFHIPLQSGSDEVLRLMNRRYRTPLFAERVEMVRALMPHAFIGVDVIAGARGETAGEWRRSLEFIASLPVSRLHCFPYSERPGTAALRLADSVPQHVRHERVAALTELSDAKLAAFTAAHAGTVRPVLWEQPHDDSGYMTGFTDNYLRVRVPLREELVNTVTPALLGTPLPGGAETVEGSLAP